jgi:hypothetical protein
VPFDINVKPNPEMKPASDAAVKARPDLVFYRGPPDSVSSSFPSKIAEQAGWPF